MTRLSSLYTAPPADWLWPAACGLTRVATILAGRETGGLSTLSWLGHSRSIHDYSHMNDDTGRARITEAHRWYCERFAGLLDRLADVPEGDGTLLDHTIVVMASCLGQAPQHHVTNVPFVLAGGRMAGLRPGRYLRYDSEKTNRLLVSLCQWMGFADVERFGLEGYSQGPLPRLTDG